MASTTGEGGGGRFIIDCSLEGYTGAITVKEGRLLATHNAAFGDVDAGTTIEEGATLEFKGAGTTTEANLFFGKELFTVCGSGVNGEGVLRHVGVLTDQWRAVFENVALSGDATFSATTYLNAYGTETTRRFDVRGAGALRLNGHTLTIKTAIFGICNASIYPDAEDGTHGKIVVDGSLSHFVREGDTANMQGSADNVLKLTNGGYADSQAAKPAPVWTLEADNGWLVNTKVSADAETSRWDGPVRLLEGGLKPKVNATGGLLTLAGKISGVGNLCARSGSVGTMRFTNTESDWTGGLTLYNTETVYAATLPGTSPYVVSAKSKLYLQATDSASFAEAVTKLDAITQANTIEGLMAVVNETGSEITNASDFDLGNRKLKYAGPDDLKLTGSQNTVPMYQLGGKVTVTGSDKTHKFGELALVNDSTMEWNNAGRVETGIYHVDIGGIYPSVARLKITDTLHTTNYAGRTSDLIQPINVGAQQNVLKDSRYVQMKNARGILEIGEGAVFTNCVWLGRAPSSNKETGKEMCHGTLLMKGGSAVLPSGDGNNSPVTFGSGGSAYVEVSGGNLTSKSWCYLSGGTKGRAVMDVSGGEYLSEGCLTFGNYSNVSTPSRGALRVRGDGYFTSWGGLIMGKTLYDTGNSGGEFVLTIEDGGTVLIDNGVDLAGQPDSVAIVNLNGGLFTPTYMQVMTNETQTHVGSGSFRELANTKAYVNFNGGELKFRRNSKSSTSKAGYKTGEFFFGDKDRIRLTSYEGGAIFNTAGYNATNSYTIAAPFGKGLVAIEITNANTIADWQFVGAPYVEISGDGSGATAIAEYDSVNGRVTGVTITSAGCGYTTIEACLARGGSTNTIPLKCTLGELASGGVTKIGYGTLLMKSANTYTGTTRVKGGTLEIANADALPANGAVAIEGGILDAGGYGQTLGAVTATSGTLKGATGSCASFKKTESGLFELDSPIEVRDGVIEVAGGTLRLPLNAPGLIWGEEIGGNYFTDFSKRVALTNRGYDLTPSHAYNVCSDDDYYQPKHYVSYSGYVWNRSETNEVWSFAMAFDDELALLIDGTVVSFKKNGTASWGALYTASTTLTPGAHSFLLQLKNNSGDGGAVRARNVSGCENWRTDIVGFAYDNMGRGSTNGNDYVHMIDPGDGSLFTTMKYADNAMPDFNTIKISAGAKLDLNGATLEYDKALHFTAGDTAASVFGAVKFMDGASVVIDNIDELEIAKSPYNLMTAVRGITGDLPKLDGSWILRKSADGNTLRLKYAYGMRVIIR